MLQSAKHEKWVKIRIGEPITAIDLSNQYLVFGSISGYVGMYNIPKQDLRYIQDIFEEIIRGIYIRPDQKAYISVGDYQGLTMDIEKRDWESFKYSKRAHNPTICSSTLALLKRERVALLTVAPTQNKELMIDITIQKNNIFLINLIQENMTSYNIEMPQLCVPFDFDGQRIILLEYLRGAKKRIQLFDFDNQTIQVVFEIPNHVEFISHGRLIKNLIIYVEDHKKVKCFNLENKKDELLFTMQGQIMAFDICDLDESPQYDEESKNEIKFRELKTTLQQVQISAVDYYSNYVHWQDFKALQNFNILGVPSVHQDLVKHKYIFDMGYPYYLRTRQGRMAVTSDLGILIYTL